MFTSYSVTTLPGVFNSYGMLQPGLHQLQFAAWKLAARVFLKKISYLSVLLIADQLQQSA